MPRDDSSETVNLMPRVAAAIEWTRLISALAVLSSLVGALVMFWGSPGGASDSHFRERSAGTPVVQGVGVDLPGDSPLDFGNRR